MKKFDKIPDNLFQSFYCVFCDKTFFEIKYSEQYLARTIGLTGWCPDCGACIKINYRNWFQRIWDKIKK